jgi:hypothetical protein
VIFRNWTLVPSISMQSTILDKKSGKN